jgi:hypothetical protein
MTRREGERRREFFGEHVRRWQESGLTQREYCGAEGLGVSAFGYWKRKLCDEVAAGEDVELVEVQCGRPRQRRSAGLVLTIGDRLSVVISEETDDVLLERVLRLLKVV